MKGRKKMKDAGWKKIVPAIIVFLSTINIFSPQAHAADDLYSKCFEKHHLASCESLETNSATDEERIKFGGEACRLGAEISCRFAINSAQKLGKKKELAEFQIKYTELLKKSCGSSVSDLDFLSCGQLARLSPSKEEKMKLGRKVGDYFLAQSERKAGTEAAEALVTAIMGYYEAGDSEKATQMAKKVMPNLISMCRMNGNNSACQDTVRLERIQKKRGWLDSFSDF